MDIQDRASEQIALGEKYPSELHYTDDNRYEAVLTTSLSWQGIAALSVVYRFTRTWKLTIWDVANRIAAFQSIISLGGPTSDEALFLYGWRDGLFGCFQKTFKYCRTAVLGIVGSVD